MTKTRLEAFSDGVIAILITIMVLELGVPHGTDISALRPLAPVLLSYVLSFYNLALWWNNHHHLLQAARHVDGRILWANLYLLFWLSLLPWATAWMGENEFASIPVAAYGFILLNAGVAYFLLVRAFIRHEGRDSVIAQATGRDRKGIGSAVAYAAAVPIALIAPWVSIGIYVAVALLWAIPDTRISSRLAHEEHREGHGEA
jgi:uncharacterized membrane protein